MSIQHQIQLAERSGPGFLDYCPLRPGRAPARYDLLIPHGGTIPGNCISQISRRPDADYVTFRAHWDARSVRRGEGTNVLVYFVSRRRAPQLATPTPLLIRESGPLPP